MLPPFRKLHRVFSKQLSFSILQIIVFINEQSYFRNNIQSSSLEVWPSLMIWCRPIVKIGGINATFLWKSCMRVIIANGALVMIWAHERRTYLSFISAIRTKHFGSRASPEMVGLNKRIRYSWRYGFLL